MNLNKFLGLFLTVGVCLLLFSACQKEETIDATAPFVKKMYQPINNVDIKETVTNFISSVAATNTQKTSFRNTEVNEGMWLMEAAFNYLYNRNLRQKTVETRKYEISIQNVSVSGKLELKGSDMTEQFEVLEKRMNDYGSKKGLVVKLIDFEVRSVDKEQTQLVVKVVYGSSANARLSGSTHCENYDSDAGYQPMWAEADRMEACIMEDVLCTTVSSSNTVGCWFSSAQVVSHSNLIAPSIAQIEYGDDFIVNDDLYSTDFGLFLPGEFETQLEITRNIIFDEIAASHVSSDYYNTSLVELDIHGVSEPEYYGNAWIEIIRIIAGVGNAY